MSSHAIMKACEEGEGFHRDAKLAGVRLGGRASLQDQTLLSLFRSCSHSAYISRSLTYSYSLPLFEVPLVMAAVVLGSPRSPSTSLDLGKYIYLLYCGLLKCKHQ